MIKKIFLSLLLCTMCMFAMAQSTTTTHIVQRGETLESIAEQYNVSVDDINKANPNTDGIIYVGMKLNIPVGNSPKTEFETAKATPTKDSYKENRTFVSQPTLTSKEKAVNDESGAQLGFQIARIKGAYYFPTKIEKSEEGHYRSSFMLSFVVEGEYVFKSNVFTGFGLGYMGNGSCNSDKREDSFDHTQYKSEWHHVVIPLSIGYRMPISKNTHFDVYTGPAFSCVVAGNTQIRLSTSEKWEKTTLKDMKDVKYLLPYWNVGARINLWNFELGVEYWRLLIKKAKEGECKGAIAAYFAFHL